MSFTDGQRVRVRTKENRGVVMRTGMVSYRTGEEFYWVELDDIGASRTDLAEGFFHGSEMQPLADEGAA